MMTLADCAVTMVLILAPLGSNSQFEGMQLQGSACASSQLSTAINAQYELVLTTEWQRFVIPLPRRDDRIRLHYHFENAYAYFGDCRYGMMPYYFKGTHTTDESICQRVMVRFGPKGVY